MTSQTDNLNSEELQRRRADWMGGVATLSLVFLVALPMIGTLLLKAGIKVDRVYTATVYSSVALLIACPTLWFGVFCLRKNIPPRQQRATRLAVTTAVAWAVLAIAYASAVGLKAYLDRTYLWSSRLEEGSTALLFVLLPLTLPSLSLGTICLALDTISRKSRMVMIVFGALSLLSSLGVITYTIYVFATTPFDI